MPDSTARFPASGALAAKRPPDESAKDDRAPEPDWIPATVDLRGGGGCQHYNVEGRVAEHPLPPAPDPVLIGGISQQVAWAASPSASRIDRQVSPGQQEHRERDDPRARAPHPKRK
jgi:hypothetical protein